MITLTVSELLQKPPARRQLIDVRTPAEFASGHIPGAVNIPMDQIESRLEDLSSEMPVLLVCQAGTRARMTANSLAAKHVSEIAVLEGGTDAWARARLPLVCCVKTRWSLERQVRLVAGILALTGAILALTLGTAWIALSGFIGLGLTFAGFTDICPMASLLAKLPWNRPRQCQPAIPITESSQ